MRQRRSAFSLAEVILALGLLAVAIMALMGVSLTVLRTDSKALETAAGQLVADQILQRLTDHLTVDSTARKDFFKNEYVTSAWDTNQITNDHTVFYYTVHASSVLDTSGQKVGREAPTNGLKKADVKVWWSAEADHARQGQGRLEVNSTVLISEAALALPEETP